VSAGLARPWLVLTGLALGLTVTNGFARFAYGLILPAMKSEMGWTYAQAGWLNTANALGYILGALLTMLLIRRVPPARLFAFGVVTTTLALLATGLYAALWWQTLWRIAAGVLGAMSFSTAGALAAGLFHGDSRRNALAIAILFGSGGGLGIVLAGRQVADPGSGEGRLLAKMRLHRIASDVMLDLGYSSKLLAEWDFFLMLKEAGRAAASQFLEQHGADLGVRSTLDIDCYLEGI